MAFTETWALERYVRDGFLFTRCRLLLRVAILLSLVGIDPAVALQGNATRLYNLATT
jgi:hypothetical protein